MKPEQILHYAPVIHSGIGPDGRWIYAVVRRSSPEGIRLELLFCDREGEWVAPPGEEERVAPAINRDGDRWAALWRQPADYRVVLGRLSRLSAPPEALPQGPTHPRVLKWAFDDTLVCMGEDARGDARVWRWPDPEGAPEPLTPHQHRLSDYALHPAAPRVAWLSREHPAHPSTDGVCRIFVGGLDLSQPREIPAPGYVFGFLSWSPCGRWLAMKARPAAEPLAAARLYLRDLERELEDPEGSVCVSEGIDGAVGDYDWAPGGHFLVAAVEEGTAGRLYRLAPGQPPQPFGPVGGFLSGPRLDRAGGRMVVLQQDLKTPQRLCVVEPGAPTRALGRFSERLSKVKMADGEVLRWQSGGELIEGILQRPEGPGPHPLLVWVHGGPTHHISQTFSPYFQVFVGAGYAVLAPNYRGSTGRGDAFCAAGAGRLCEADAADLRAGIDLAAERGVADPGRVGAVGWSYGGTLALALARTDPRIRAVAAGSPVADWVGLLGASTFPTTAWHCVGTLPWEDRRPWDAASPASWIREVRAPTLLLHGTEDASVPFAQSLLLYRLMLACQIPCELAWYRGEGHTLQSPVATVDMLRQMLRWFDLYLKAGV